MTTATLHAVDGSDTKTPAAETEKTEKPDFRGQPGMVLDEKGRVMTRPGFPNNPHVLLVNIGNAVSDKTLFDLLCAVRRETQARVWTNNAPTALVSKVMADPAILPRTFTTNAVLTVMIERSPEGNPITIAPRSWARLNLYGIDAAKPEATVRDTLYTRAVLRAVAFGMGAGLSSQPHCLMSGAVQSWPDMLKTGPNFSPEASMAIMQFIRQYNASAGLAQLWKLGGKK